MKSSNKKFTRLTDRLHLNPRIAGEMADETLSGTGTRHGKSRVAGAAIRVAAASMLGFVLVVAGLAPSNAVSRQARTVDYNCKVSTVSFNKGYSTFWAAEGVGLVAWRVSANLRVYDQCNHGGIEGTISIYSANVKYKGGKIGITNFVFADSSRNAWRRDGVSLRYSFSSGGWDNFDVRVSGNIGLTPTTWIRYIRTYTALSFYGVPGASRYITCGKGNPMFRAYAC